jgi:hypothetical protein
MKKLIKISNIFMIAVAMLFVSTACEENFDEFNTDPNNPSFARAEWLLTSAQKRAIDETWDEWVNARTGMYYAQYWSGTSYTEESQYQIREGVNNAFWSGMYAGALADLVQAKVLAETGTQEGILDLMIAWSFHVLTDKYGAIPFENAVLGLGNPTPNYDSQEDVYNALLTMIDAALVKLDDSERSFGSGDVLYGGDVAKWRKFGNSLKLRVGMRMVNANPTAARAAVEAAASGAFTSNADNALMNYEGEPNNNPLHENSKTRADFAVSSTLIDYMKSVDDPRISVYANETVNHPGEYIGLAYGLSNANATAIANAEVSMPGDIVYKNASAPGVYIDYAEVRFILAEAAARGWNVTGTAEEHYNAAITASLGYWGITDPAVVNAYLAEVPYSAGDWKDVIGTQKWLALYMQGLQGWYERLRLRFNKPDGTALFINPVDGSLDADVTDVPTRMTYPTDEQTLNAASYTAAVETQGADKKSTKLWWHL